jgi:hypothetical protein
VCRSSPTRSRTHGVIETLTSKNVMTFADKAYQGARGSIRTPFKHHRYRPTLSAWQKQSNRAHARIRTIVNAPMPPSRLGKF